MHDEVLTNEFFSNSKEYISLRLLYQSALREISTKLEILNDEFQIMHDYNPIEHIKSRIKSPESILRKLKRQGFPVSIASARENLNDIAGIRVICSFIDDIYKIAKTLTQQDDVTLVTVRDYIKHPKLNGYKSLHLIVEIPIFFSERVEHVRVEIQVRTVAMDFWASLEHKLQYKSSTEVSLEDVKKQLKDASDVVSKLDEQMMYIHKQIKTLNR